MPTFHIVGADKQTGEDKSFVISADSEAAAVANVDSQVFVSSVTRAESIPPANTVPNQLSYRSPRKDDLTAIPKYSGLKMVGSIAFGYALVLYAIAAISVLFAGYCVAMSMISPSSTRTVMRSGFPPFASYTSNPSSDYLSSAISVLILALSIMFGAIVAHGLASACNALRDIARNSFASK